MPETSPVLEADYALSLNDRGRFRDHWTWTGWRSHKWPAAIVRPGLLIYTFDLETRLLTQLLRITRGGSFSFRSMEEFSKQVETICGRKPDPALDQEQWQKIARRCLDKHRCTGICLGAEVIKDLSIHLTVQVDRVGWLKLK